MSGSYKPLGRHATHNNLSKHTSKPTMITQDIPLRRLSFGEPSLLERSSPTRSGKTKKTRCCNWRQDPGGTLSRYWIWELLASAFSMICIATIVIVLIYENGRRLDRWALMISPNAVISFIAALAKSSCMLVLAEMIGQLRWIHFAHQPHKLSDLQV